MEADYVIVGAGSAGCVLAERLSAGGAGVVLLEAGGKDTNPLIHVPAGVLKLITHPVVNWNYYTEPDEKTGNRAFHCPRGKVLGGSSSINGMLFIRGNAADFDGWAQMGARPAGPMTTSKGISRASSATGRATRANGANRGRFRSRTTGRSCRSPTASSKRRSRRGIPSPGT